MALVIMLNSKIIQFFGAIDLNPRGCKAKLKATVTPLHWKLPLDWKQQL